MSATTATQDSTAHYNAVGERVWPCRCGETHSGPYGIYDYAHHNCFHDAELVRVCPDDEPRYLMCPQCGKTFWIAEDTPEPKGQKQ